MSTAKLKRIGFYDNSATPEPQLQFYFNSALVKTTTAINTYNLTRLHLSPFLQEALLIRVFKPIIVSGPQRHFLVLFCLGLV